VCPNGIGLYGFRGNNPAQSYPNVDNVNSNLYNGKVQSTRTKTGQLDTVGQIG